MCISINISPPFSCVISVEYLQVCNECFYSGIGKRIFFFRKQSTNQRQLFKRVHFFFVTTNFYYKENTVLDNTLNISDTNTDKVTIFS